MSANDETSRRINRDGAGNSTWSVHGGEKYQRFAKSVTEPIAQTATYVFESLDEFEAYKQGHRSHYEYGRYGNPTIQAAEQKLAALDSAEAALMFSSGMSAITTVLLAILRSGQHMIIMEDCYRRTVQLCDLLGKYGVECTRVQPGDFAALKSADSLRRVADKSPPAHRRSGGSRTIRQRASPATPHRQHFRHADQPAPRRVRCRSGLSQCHQVPGRAQRSHGGYGLRQSTDDSGDQGVS